MDWMPIESAPKDGTTVIYGTVKWVTCGHYADEGWWEMNNSSTDAWGGVDYPTHWMPLPPPPAEQQG